MFRWFWKTFLQLKGWKTEYNFPTHLKNVC
jgi:hypothetical protein